jgi:MFS family permease
MSAAQPPPERVRKRLTRVLFAAVAAANTGYIAAITVSTLAATAITGSPRLAGLPSALAVAGTAAGTALWSQLAPTKGRRFGLVVGYLVATAGAAVAAGAVIIESYPLLVGGMAVLGFGQASSHLARYASAELAEASHRGRAVSTIVWAGTVGAVIGPRLLEPAGAISDRIAGTTYAGGFLATSAFMAIATVILDVFLRPDPSSIALIEEPAPEVRPTGPAITALGHPGVQLAAVAMVVGQAVMVLIMTATPLHIEDTGFGLDWVGTIISAHTLGMFAFSPVTGRLTDLIGPVRMIAASAVVLGISAAMAATAPDGANVLLGWGLFLLGLGWNFGFVAGSALLTASVAPDIRPLVQGRVDAAVWIASASASFSAGLVFDGPGYRSLGFIGATMVALPIVALVLRGRRASEPASVMLS